MTTLYRPVLIESAEQAEALPIGTVGHEPPHLYAYIKKARNYWRGTGDDAALTDYEMLPFTALVPIEAEEETSVIVSAPGSRDIDAHPYSEASMDSDGNVWFGDGLRRMDVTEQFNEWAKQHTRTRYVTPWEEA